MATNIKLVAVGDGDSGKTNLCSKIRATQGKGLMPDGTSRFTARGKVCSDTRTVQLLKRPPG